MQKHVADDKAATGAARGRGWLLSSPQPREQKLLGGALPRP